MLDDDYLLEVPIYTIDETSFNREFEGALEREAESRYGFVRDLPGKDLAWCRERVEKEKSSHLRGFGGPWRYNQICGLLGIYPLGDQLRGDYWRRSGRIYRRTSRKCKIEYQGTAFEATISTRRNVAATSL
ncbi:MAG TPA: hypothetical protein VHG32_21360 [Thermoanaerobaculia bacterium]|jgi:hypothetical protein|nr:hypothetical protein [Thermoanaerobaculia bacterium]